MNRADLIESIAKQTNVSKVAADAALRAVTGAITQALKKGDAVQLVGFGTFKVVKRAARIGKNPNTGEKLKIAAAKVPRFVPGAALKSSVNPKRK